MKAVKLKLGTRMGSGLMYCVYQNQGQGPTTFDSFYNLPLMKNFPSHFSLELKGLQS